MFRTLLRSGNRLLADCHRTLVLVPTGERRRRPKPLQRYGGSAPAQPMGAAARCTFARSERCKRVRVTGVAALAGPVRRQKAGLSISGANKNAHAFSHACSSTWQTHSIAWHMDPGSFLPVSRST
jgi:hypothetical protein